MTDQTPADPTWFTELPEKRQGRWNAGDSTFSIARTWGPWDRGRVIMKDGTVLNGTKGDERNRWDRKKHAIAIRIPGRKTQKWLLVCEIANITSDSGATLTEMLEELLNRP